MEAWLFHQHHLIMLVIVCLSVEQVTQHLRRSLTIYSNQSILRHTEETVHFIDLSLLKTGQKSLDVPKLISYMYCQAGLENYQDM